MTNPTPHGQVPAIQRYKIGYHSDEWGVRSLSPSGIYDDAGPWVRYEDHAAVITALRAYCQELEAQVILDCMTHDQKPAEIEHVAGDVSKNGAEVNMSTQQQECGNTPYDEGPFALAQPVAQRGAADGFFLLLPQRPKPEAPAGTAGLDWDAYSGAQMLAFGRDCSDAAIAALRTQQPAPAPQQEAQEPVAFPTMLRKMWSGLEVQQWINENWPRNTAPQPAPAELERLRERISKMGLDVDRAMRGHVNEQSPLGTTRLAAIAALAKPAPAPLSEQDPLQGAANWLAQAHGQFCVSVLQGCLMIGHNRAKRLHDAALAAQKGTP